MKIETEELFWECGDKCCTEWSTALYIDGRLVEDREFASAGDAYRYVLETVLGHEVDEKDE